MASIRAENEVRQWCINRELNYYKQRRRRQQRERQKKQEGFDWQNSNFARASRFFLYFFAVVARLKRETSCFHVL